MRTGPPHQPYPFQASLLRTISSPVFPLHCVRPAAVRRPPCLTPHLLVRPSRASLSTPRGNLAQLAPPCYMDPPRRDLTRRSVPTRTAAPWLHPPAAQRASPGHATRPPAASPARSLLAPPTVPPPWPPLCPSTPMWPPCPSLPRFLCCSRRAAALLPKEGIVAPVAGRCCCRRNQQTTAREQRRCSVRQRRCYKGRPTLLPWCTAALLGHCRCYQGTSAMLPTTADTATYGGGGR